MILGVLLVGLVTILFICTATVVQGCVLSILWNWFMPVLFGLPTLGVAGAIGVTMVFRFMKGMDYESDKKKNGWDVIFTSVIVYPLVTLLLGYIVKQFM